MSPLSSEPDVGAGDPVTRIMNSEGTSALGQHVTLPTAPGGSATDSSSTEASETKSTATASNALDVKA